MRRLSFLAVFLVAMLWPQLAHAATLSVSSSPTHSAPAPLSGQTLSGNQYIFTDVGPVTFRLDGVVRRTENIAPWDFNGSTGSNGIPFNVDALSPGQHTVTATLSSETLSGTFQVGGGPPPPPPPPPTGSPFLYDPLAIFNQPIPASKRTTLSAQFGTNVVAGIRGDSPPINIAPAGTPNRTAVLGSRTTTFPIPNGIAFGTGSDYPTIVRDPPTFRELRCWRGTFDGTTLRCQGGGLFYINADGRVLNPDGSLSLGHAYFGGGAGNGLNYSAGMVTMADFLSGSINHAIRIASGCVSGQFWPPARKSDQNDSGCPPMGAMSYLPDGIACPTSQPSDPDDRELLRQVCAALRIFGAMRSDGTGADQVAYFEGEASAHWFQRGLTGCNSSLSCLMRLLPWTQMRQAGQPASYISW